MPSEIAETAAEAARWRRELHRHPELLYDLQRTSAFVAGKLQAFGIDRVVSGIGRSGVVGVLAGRRPGPTLALRADMDALPIGEITGAPWASEVEGCMHACGHDGHTATLLAAAAALARRRDFAGTVVFVFQPAEEGGGGALAMIEDGLLEDFAIEEIYGLHNMPGLAVGRFALRPGPIMASADRFYIDITGRGGHAARPNQAIDPVLVGAELVTALQSIVSRSVDPLASAVVSVTTFHAGTTDNVIPQTARLSGTYRALSAEVRAEVGVRIEQLARELPAVFGAQTDFSIRTGYPVTVNHRDKARLVADVAAGVVGPSAVDDATAPMMLAEDFAYYLERRPGAFLFMGNGDTAGLHHPAYDFDDGAIAYGAALWTALVERRLAA